ncbi:MAG: hypothetical protein ACXWLH_02620 [Candidatus Saccharimonadales bacterium]
MELQNRDILESNWVRRAARIGLVTVGFGLAAINIHAFTEGSFNSNITIVDASSLMLGLALVVTERLADQNLYTAKKDAGQQRPISVE